MVIDCDAILRKSIPKLRAILNPSLISLGLYPAYRYFFAYLRIEPMRSVEVVVPSPANLFVELTDFLIKVHTAS